MINKNDSKVVYWLLVISIISGTGIQSSYALDCPTAPVDEIALLSENLKKIDTCIEGLAQNKHSFSAALGLQYKELKKLITLQKDLAESLNVINAPLRNIKKAEAEITMLTDVNEVAQAIAKLQKFKSENKKLLAEIEQKVVQPMSMMNKLKEEQEDIFKNTNILLEAINTGASPEILQAKFEQQKITDRLQSFYSQVRSSKVAQQNKDLSSIVIKAYQGALATLNDAKTAFTDSYKEIRAAYLKAAQYYSMAVKTTVPDLKQYYIAIGKSSLQLAETTDVARKQSLLYAINTYEIIAIMYESGRPSASDQKVIEYLIASIKVDALKLQEKSEIKKSIYDTQKITYELLADVYRKQALVPSGNVAQVVAIGGKIDELTKRALLDKKMDGSLWQVYSLVIDSYRSSMSLLKSDQKSDKDIVDPIKGAQQQETLLIPNPDTQIAQRVRQLYAQTYTIKNLLEQQSDKIQASRKNKLTKKADDTAYKKIINYVSTILKSPEVWLEAAQIDRTTCLLGSIKIALIDTYQADYAVFIAQNIDNQKSNCQEGIAPALYLDMIKRAQTVEVVDTVAKQLKPYNQADLLTSKKDRTQDWLLNEKLYWIAVYRKYQIILAQIEKNSLEKDTPKKLEEIIKGLGFLHTNAKDLAQVITVDGFMQIKVTPQPVLTVQQVALDYRRAEELLKKIKEPVVKDAQVGAQQKPIGTAKESTSQGSGLAKLPAVKVVPAKSVPEKKGPAKSVPAKVTKDVKAPVKAVPVKGKKEVPKSLGIQEGSKKNSGVKK